MTETRALCFRNARDSFVTLVSLTRGSTTRLVARALGATGVRVEDETGVEIVVESAREDGDGDDVERGRVEVDAESRDEGAAKRGKVADRRVVQTHGERDVVVDGAKVRLIESREDVATRGGGDDVDGAVRARRGDDAPREAGRAKHASRTRALVVGKRFSRARRTDERIFVVIIDFS